MKCAIVLVLCRLFATHIQPSAKPPWCFFIGFSSTNLKPSFDLHFFVHHKFPSISIMLSSSSGYAADNNVSGIADACVPADQPAPTPPVHTATSRHSNLLPLFRRIAESDIPAHLREADSMNLQDAVGEPDVCSFPLPPHLYATWARQAHINITLDQLKY